MMWVEYGRLALLAVAGIMLTGCSTQTAPGPWSPVWQELRRQQSEPAPVPIPARTNGAPVSIDGRVLFRFSGNDEVKLVHLAGDFNNWADNDQGRVASTRFAMTPAGEGRWYRWEELQPGDRAYVYVVEKADGTFDWREDPQAAHSDGQGHSLFTVHTPATPAIPPMESFLDQPSRRDGLEVSAERVWVRPGESNTLLVSANAAPVGMLGLRIFTPMGKTVHTSRHEWDGRQAALPLPPMEEEGGYLATVTTSGEGSEPGHSGDTVLTVARNIADDLRYGFYASFASAGGDYAAKADMLARLHVNAVEFYDYFPAHGKYAPTEEDYVLGPFGLRINARDVQNKIEAGHARNILSIAYVAAYAASPEIYQQYPYPMTDHRGVPKVFNGQVMTEDEADRLGKDKWYWIMNIAGDSPWHAYILEEFARALDHSPGDLVGFDGFELDTYGDAADARFFARGSSRDGDLLSEVLRDFVGDVREKTREVKPHGLVSFNSINEFGVDKMYDVTDFLFMEIWRFYTARLETLIDICHRQREARRQRVVLKLYPADMDPKQSAWPPGALARLLGATMTGAGSLMVVGEPDEARRTMHGLNTLFYPDHRPLVSGNEEMIRAYYRHDAMLFGLTHGTNVFNTRVEARADGCITRTYAAPEHESLVVQLLRTGDEPRWSVAAELPAPARDLEVLVPLPANAVPRRVLYASPDHEDLRAPVELPFESDSGELRVHLPSLRVHGTLILTY